jgi:hypothetical protein
MIVCNLHLQATCLLHSGSTGSSIRSLVVIVGRRRKTTTATTTGEYILQCLARLKSVTMRFALPSPGDAVTLSVSLTKRPIAS